MSGADVSDVSIREIRTDDAVAFLELCQALDRETTLMMLEPDERITSVAEQRAAIANVLATDNATIVVADAEHELAGYVAATGGRYRREHSTAYIVAGVRQAYAGRGVGGQLFAELERWARARGLRRLELTVQTRNALAVRLYSKLGFEIEGTRRQALRVDGVYIDEHYMGKVLD
jgi:RimJ/RimL family protein N-acetyltransferase